MSDYNTLIFYPGHGDKLDLISGLEAWVRLGGRFESDLAIELAPFDEETYIEDVRRGYHRFQRSDLNSLGLLAENFDLHLSLNAPWFTMPIEVSSYHHANSPILFLWFDPALWGMGEGGCDWADSAVLDLARHAGAAYVLTVSGLGYETVRTRLVPDESGYKFVLPSPDSGRGHRIRWIDICEELGGQDPSGYVESERRVMPHGYVRHMLCGTFSPKAFR
jgi:hypothetical protein